MEPTYNLPALPHIREVRQIVQSGSWEDDTASVVLICPDPMAGRPNRFSVIRIHRFTGLATCIGRELQLIDAREVAQRPEGEDGTRLYGAALRQSRKLAAYWGRQANRKRTSKEELHNARANLRHVKARVREDEQALRRYRKAAQKA